MRTKTSRYVELPPSAPAAPHLACTWIGETGDDGGYTDRVLPDACIDVIWDGERLFVAGPDTGPVVGAHAPGTVFVGLRFRPGRGPAFLGVPACEIVDQRIDAEDVWGASTAAQLREELAGLAPDAAARGLEARVAALAADDADEARLVDGVVDLALHTDVESLASEIGVTARTLHRRSLAAFGYGAKTLQRVLRFRTFLALAERMPNASLGRLAAEAGYADHAHLVRDCRSLAGLAPGALLVSRRVRSVQDDEWLERAG